MLRLASIMDRVALRDGFKRTWGHHPLGPRIVGDEIILLAIPTLTLLYQ